MVNLIAETNGTRAAYHPVNVDGTVVSLDSSKVTIAVTAWDSGGFALVADAETGQLVRAADAPVFTDEGERCRFTALDMSAAATGNLML